MIESFGDQATKDVFLARVTRHSRSLPLQLHGVIRRKLDLVDAAADISDLRAPPGNRLERLRGNLEGSWSIRVNDQYRIVFQFQAGEANEVTCRDYH